MTEIDLQHEARRLCRLRALGGPEGRLATRPPKVELRRARGFFQKTDGWADPNGDRKVVVYAHPCWPDAWVRETLLHELTHLCGKAGCATHSTRFKRVLLRASEEAWGLDLGNLAKLAEGRMRSVDVRIAWHLLRASCWERIGAWMPIWRSA